MTNIDEKSYNSISMGGEPEIVELNFCIGKPSIWARIFNAITFRSFRIKIMKLLKQ